MFYIKYFYFFILFFISVFIFYFLFLFFFLFIYFLFIFETNFFGWINHDFFQKLHRSIIRWTLFWQEKRKVWDSLDWSSSFHPSLFLKIFLFVTTFFFIFFLYYFFIFIFYFYFILFYFYFFILIKYIFYYLQKKDSHHLNRVIPKNNQNKKNKPNHDSLFFYFEMEDLLLVSISFLCFEMNRLQNLYYHSKEIFLNEYFNL